MSICTIIPKEDNQHRTSTAQDSPYQLQKMAIATGPEVLVMR